MYPTTRSSRSTFVGLVTVLSVIATAACSAATAEDGAGSGSSAQTTDAATDAAPAVDGGDDLVCPKPGDVTEADVEQAFSGPWKRPATPANVCTQADVDKVKALFAQNPSVKFAELKSAMSDACGSCVFTPNTANAWGTLVEFSDGIYQNYASCYAQVTNADCGKNLAYFDICLNAVCDEGDCGSQQATQACTRKAASGGCKTFTQGVQTSCGEGGLDAIDKQCGNIFQLMAVTCGGGPNHTLNTTP